MMGLKALESLTSADLLRMETWVNSRGGGANSTDYLGILKWLTRAKSWSDNKQEIFEIFGEKLILEKSVKIENGLYYKLESARNLIWSSPLYDSIRSVTTKYGFTCPVVAIIGASALATNRISFEGAPKIPSIDSVIEEIGETRKNVDGMKPYKFLKKLVKVYKEAIPEIDWEGQLEDFRVQHSLINNSEIGGTLCLSIHPMDFITMSDNGYDWGSCMSWDSNNGCGSGKSGTLSMLQSKTAVVAYIKGDMKYNIANYPPEKEEDFWNSKKWRQLYYIDRESIVGSRQYPFASPEATAIVRAWLKELCEEHYGISYKTIEDVQPIHFRSKVLLPDENIFIERISFGSMYNDFSTIGSTSIEVNQKLIDDGQNLRIKCGESALCIDCGSPVLAEGDLYCYECNEEETRLECEHCGDIIYMCDNFCRVEIGGRLCVVCSECAECHSIKDMVFINGSF